MPEIKLPELTEQEKLHKSLFTEWWKAEDEKLTYARWLEAKLAEAKRDTARLDYIINKSNTTEDQWLNENVWDGIPLDDPHDGPEAAIRAVIDAAMRQEAPTMPCPNCGNHATFSERSHLWTESHGEHCYQEWVECDICHAPTTWAEINESVADTTEPEGEKDA